jgi:hypothetical protein
MGNSKKKKQARNVIKSKTFTKQKIKVGKKLKKTNVTNTEFNAKSVVLLEQFNDNKSEPVSLRGLTIRDLNRQIGHPSLPTRRDAIIGEFLLPAVSLQSLQAFIAGVLYSLFFRHEATSHRSSRINRLQST